MRSAQPPLEWDATEWLVEPKPPREVVLLEEDDDDEDDVELLRPLELNAADVEPGERDEDRWRSSYEEFEPQCQLPQ